jgi:hypothetical protein
MKKVLSVFMFIMMVVMASMSIIAIAKGENEKTYGNLIDDVYFDSIRRDFQKAYDEGDQIRCGYLFDGCIYCATSYEMDTARWGFGKDFSRATADDFADWMQSILEMEGASHPQVRINFAGWDSEGHEFYEMTVSVMENLNEYKGKVSGSGFLEEGIEYNMTKYLCKII